MMTKLALEHFLPYRLARIGTVVSQEFREIFGRDYDLTIPEWRVLATLGQFGEMGAKAIGRHSFMHKTKVSRAVRALEERRWLKRRESLEDRREEVLALTPQGLTAYENIVPSALAYEEKLLCSLGIHAQALLDALDALERVKKMN